MDVEGEPRSMIGQEAEAGPSSPPRPALPQPRALDHSDPYLSSQPASSFDVDAFLLSRAPGASLVQIADELHTFGAQIRTELDQVVDRDFRGFVNLGVALKAEAPRIARLDWRSSAEQKDGASDVGPGTGRRRSITLRDGGSNLGLERIRSEIVGVRDQLRAAQSSVRQTMTDREEMEVRRANLQLLLSFDDSLIRLETLLMPADQRVEEEEGEEEGAADGPVDSLDGSDRFWQSFEQVDLGYSSEELSESEYSSGGEDDDQGRPRTLIRQASTTSTTPNLLIKARRRSSIMRTARRRSSLGPIEGMASLVPSSAKPAMTLPARIQRAASEHSALMFLAQRARSIGYGEYVEAHEERLAAARTALKADLAQLVKVLCRVNGASVLVGQGTNGMHQAIDQEQSALEMELGEWGTSDASDDQRRKEQSAWLEMAITTWIGLPQDSSSDRATDTSEVEEAIGRAMVEEWTQDAITSSSLDANKGGLPRKVNGTTASTPTSSYAIPYTVADDEVEKSKPLIDLYNGILDFVAQRTRHVIDLAEKVSQRQQDKQESANIVVTDQSPCDVYVRAVWRPIIARLMEKLGGQLFFVGRSDVFRRHFVISSAFLTSFAALAPSSRAAQALRSDSLYQAFRKRWQLPVYFQMRMREVVTTLEGVLTNPAHGIVARLPSSINGLVSLPLTPASQAALDAFAMPWNKHWHIRDLTHRQWRLSLQILSRYRGWFQDEVPSDALPAHRRVIDTTRTATSTAGSPTRPSFDMAQQPRFNGTSTPVLASPQRAGTPTANDVDQENHLLIVCMALAVETYWFEAQVRRAFAEKVLPSLAADMNDSQSRPGADVQAMLEQALDSALTLSTAVVPMLSAKLLSILKARCAEPLRLVRSVSTQYRTAAKGSGTSTKGQSTAAALEPSFFVTRFLRPLRQALGGPESTRANPATTTLGHHLPDQVRHRWIDEVLEDFVTRYTASLHTMVKNFESLQRLKRNNAVGTTTATNGTLAPGAAAGGGAGEETEADRMYGQMLCDVEHFEAEVHSLSTPTMVIRTDTEAWTRLRAAARGQLDE